MMISNPFHPVIYTPTYNDADALAKSFEQIKEHSGIACDRLVIDGRFHGFAQIDGSDISTDDTREVCRQYSADYMVLSPCYEQQKFNVACDTLSHQGHKVMVLCGSDEYIEMDHYSLEYIQNILKDFDNPLVLKIKIEEHNPGHKYEQGEKELPKVFCNISKMEARHIHWAVYRKNTNALLRAYRLPVTHAILHHDHTWRPKSRDDLMMKYQNYNIQREAKSTRLVDRDRFHGGI